MKISGNAGSTDRYPECERPETRPVFRIFSGDKKQIHGRGIEKDERSVSARNCACQTALARRFLKPVQERLTFGRIRERQIFTIVSKDAYAFVKIGNKLDRLNTGKSFMWPTYYRSDALRGNPEL